MSDPKLVENILRSYREHGGINHLDGANLPSREAVADILRDLLRLVFPGFYGHAALPSDQIADGVAETLSSVSRKLVREIRKSLEYRRPAPATDGRDLNVPIEARRIAEDFLADLPRIRELLASDVQAAYEGDPAAMSHDEVIVAYPGLKAIAVQRMAHQLYQARVALIPRMMTEWAHSRTGIDIHPGARIGNRFFIDHGTGVVIGETTVIGTGVKIYQGVSLGAKSFQKDPSGRLVKGTKRHPDVEDGVTLYANATILGGDTTIGARSTIAANVFLTRSVPPDSLVFYEEADLRIVPKRRAGGEAVAFDYAI
ncbi:MAG: serine acetyltransferase [Verrucomicrobiae bacterium]|nr:serine acetyltransferase [Verrucomicrobiae bacterium]